MPEPLPGRADAIVGMTVAAEEREPAFLKLTTAERLNVMSAALAAVASLLPHERAALFGRQPEPRPAGPIPVLIAGDD